MAENSDEGSKEFEATQRKLDRAREKGEVIRSEEFQAAAATLGFVVMVLALGGWAIGSAGSVATALIDRPDQIATGAAPSIGGMMARMALPLMALPLGGAVVVLIWLAASRGIVFAPSRLAPRASRLSIVANARQKFGTQGLADFARRALKIVIVGLVLLRFLMHERNAILTSALLEPGPAAELLGRILVRFLLVILVLNLLFGIADYVMQHHLFRQRQRMTRREMTDEMKESEGDPHMKADRRRRAEAIATQQMMAAVPKADVVIVNPSHYAVALKWERGKGRAPVCTAKGVDEIALRIRERAAAAGVPVRRDPPTARALHAALDIGQEIRREHYVAVAAAIRFADELRARKGGHSPGGAAS